MKKIWITLSFFAVLAGALIVWQANRTQPPAKIESAKQLHGESYWTCPMHPQIHSEHPGECPICHMKLIKVSTGERAGNEAEGDKRSAVQFTSSQLFLVGVQKTEVEKMDLIVKIPVSGRFMSPSSVAFQIYESDLRYIKRGLSFKGVSSLFPEQQVLGVISSVDSIVDPTSRTVRVIGSVKQGPRGVLSETEFRGEISFELKDRTAIPESAVVHTGEGDLVYLFTKENQLTPTPVALGLKSEEFYDVLKGVQPGQLISSGPNFLIDSESKIRAIGTLTDDSGIPSKPSCPKSQHWDTSMSMCMPGKG